MTKFNDNPILAQLIIPETAGLRVTKELDTLPIEYFGSQILAEQSNFFEFKSFHEIVDFFIANNFYFFLFYEKKPVKKEFYPTEKQMKEYGYDKDKLLSVLYDVKKEVFVEWENFILDRTCKGKTKKGKNCRRVLFKVPHHPNDFISDDHWYCNTHRES